MIINSLLDLDYYKITMSQLAFKNFPKLKVKYAFNNRTNIRLADIISKDDLIKEIEHVRELSKTPREQEDIDFLSYQGIFTPEFLEFFKTFELPKVKVEVKDGQFDITTKGYWKSAIYWETIILSIVNELYYISKYEDHDRFISRGTNSLLLKVATLSQRPDILITDFGTRRRYNGLWQDDVVSIMSSNLQDSFLGTSNVKLAKKYNLNPIGTNAHELYMISTGLWNDNLREAHSKILDMWYDMYGYDLSIALTDTFGTKSFFEDFGEERVKNWKGLRHDSGDPIKFGEKAIEFYESHGVDPKEKLIIFSDGLSMNKIIQLADHFKGRIKVVFGWGTKLTNDVGAETLSIVMKAVEVISDGDTKIDNKLVKLSDNLNKATGTPEDIERYKQEFGYTNTNRDRLEV